MVIVGAGVTGLTAACFLARAGLDVVVLEKSSRLGGRAVTTDNDGYLFNIGVHALYTGGVASRVFDDLGIPAGDRARRRAADRQRRRVRGPAEHRRVTDLRAHTRAGAAGTPTLIYDGDCGFCTSAVRLVERRLRPRCTIEPWQVTDLRSMGIPCSRAASEVLWVTPSGEVHGGAQAVAKLLLHTGGLWRYVGALLTRPPFSWLASGAYTVIARNRGKLPGGTPACALPPEQRPGVT